MIVDFLKTFNQANKGDTSGTIWATKNIDPELNPGKINISKVLGKCFSEDDDADFTGAIADFALFNSRYYAVGTDKVWRTSGANPYDGWAEVTDTPENFSINSAIATFNGKLYAASTTNLESYNDSAWAVVSASITNTPHSMAVYKNRLYITDSTDQVWSMNTAESLATSSSYTIDIGTYTGGNQLITKIAAVSNGIWIATIYTDKAGGEMIFWDGVTADIADARYLIPRGVLAMCIKDDRPYIIDSLGRLRVLDGTTFSEIARLPIFKEDLYNFADNDNDRFVHPNGMIVVNNEIYILVSNRREEQTKDPLERLPSGIWAWNPDFGLYHKYSFVNSDITVASPTITDFGANELAHVGALFQTDAVGLGVDLADASEVLAGLTFVADGSDIVSADKAAIAVTNMANDIQKAGYLVTAQLTAETFDETWKEVIAVHDLFKNSTDRIVIKYRTTESDPVYTTGTWSTDTILRSSTALTTTENGDEVEILRGEGAGCCFEITSILNNDRMQLDYNPLTGMSGTCRFRVQKWLKVGTALNTDEHYIRKTLDAKPGAWVQFKVFMVGTGKSPQLIKLLSVSQPHTNYK